MREWSLGHAVHSLVVLVEIGPVLVVASRTILVRSPSLISTHHPFLVLLSIHVRILLHDL